MRKWLTVKDLGKELGDNKDVVERNAADKSERKIEEL